MARLQVEVSPGIFGCDASALGRRGNHDGTRHKMCWAMTSAGKMRDDRPSKPAKCTYRKIIRINTNAEKPMLSISSDKPSSRGVSAFPSEYTSSNQMLPESGSLRSIV